MTDTAPSAANATAAVTATGTANIITFETASLLRTVSVPHIFRSCHVNA